MKWIKNIVPLEETIEEGTYFLAKPIEATNGTISYFYLCRNSQGKQCWAGKLGIAIHLIGGENLLKLISGNPSLSDLVAIEVPPDADKRWKRCRR